MPLRALIAGLAPAFARWMLQRLNNIGLFGGRIGKGLVADAISPFCAFSRS